MVDIAKNLVKITKSTYSEKMFKSKETLINFKRKWKRQHTEQRFPKELMLI